MSYLDELVGNAVLPARIGEIEDKAEYGVSDEDEKVWDAEIAYILRLIAIVLQHGRDAGVNKVAHWQNTRQDNRAGPVILTLLPVCTLMHKTSHIVRAPQTGQI